MKAANPPILTINGDSASMKFMLYQVGKPPKRRLYGKVNRIGLSGTNLTFDDPTRNQQDSRSLAASDHKSAGNFLIDWLDEQNGFESVRAPGHRVVLGIQHTAPELVTQELLDEPHRVSPFDPKHLPREIELVQTVRQRHPRSSGQRRKHGHHGRRQEPSTQHGLHLNGGIGDEHTALVIWTPVTVSGANRADNHKTVFRNGQPQVWAARRFGDQFRHARLAREKSQGCTRIPGRVSGPTANCRNRPL